MSRLTRTLKKTAVGVSLLALAAGVVIVGGGAYLFLRAEPSYSGVDKIAAFRPKFRLSVTVMACRIFLPPI